jgi:ubiquinone/menaquinone biosynthesis C-methylase UbiE
MAAFGSLPPIEQARQLANPEGQVGIEVAEWLNGNNRAGIARALAMLDVRAGHRVLEIGFGNGRAAPVVVGQGADVHYAGIDISPTMVDEANRFNAALVTVGRASFRLASADCMPFGEASFDRVFAIGVMHFWQDPRVPLREIHRVMRPDGFAVMGALDSQSPPPFARPEFGFHLRSAAEWVELWRQAGFGAVDAQRTESDQITEDGAATRRYTIQLTARR